MIRRYDVVVAVVVIGLGTAFGAALGWLRGLDLDVDI